MLTLIPLLLCFTYLDGTLVMAAKPDTLVGNVARRLTGGDEYAHAGIILDNQVYEIDWPRVKKTVAGNHTRRNGVYVYYAPKTPYTPEQVSRMRSSLESRLGRRYQLRNYLRPGSRPTGGSWRSPFAAATLNASVRYRITATQGREPQSLLDAARQDYIQIGGN